MKRQLSFPRGAFCIVKWHLEDLNYTPILERGYENWYADKIGCAYRGLEDLVTQVIFPKKKLPLL